jgi:copper chaperone CopZ
MKQTFKVENVKCGGCANTLKKKLLNRFGEVEVNLEVTPREKS